MSFQHFRLGELSLGQPLPPHLMQIQRASQAGLASTAQSHPDSATQFPGQLQNNIANNISQGNLPTTATSTSKQPYGSGDSDDGYTLIFPNLDAFHAWRNQEEETQMVEFVKGDTHGSKAVPPRFKDHTKLVCARHSRSGRKKYVKKHPERVRKVPSRKLEGQGCLASISYKTYFDTDEVRACYNSQHSHEIGLANLPFTRRGRKAAVQQEKETRRHSNAGDANENSSTPSPSNLQHPAPPTTHTGSFYPSSVSLIAPLPQTFQHPQPQPFVQHPYAPPPHPQPFPSAPNPGASTALAHDRWERMAVLFQSIREHARGFEYPGPSVVALESVLIRLYLESPVGSAAHLPVSGAPSVLGQNGLMVQPTPTQTDVSLAARPAANSSAADD